MMPTKMAPEKQSVENMAIAMEALQPSRPSRSCFSFSAFSESQEQEKQALPLRIHSLTLGKYSTFMQLHGTSG